MRTFTIVVSVVLAALLVPRPGMGQGKLTLSSKRVPDFAAELLVGDGVTHRDVPRPNGLDTDIQFIRLYEVPEVGGCQGTDETCQRHYALVLMTGGMPPDLAMYDLGTVGEITQVQWVSSPARQPLAGSPTVMSQSAEATLAVTVQNYPSTVLGDHRSLARQLRRYLLVANMDSVTTHTAN